MVDLVRCLAHAVAARREGPLSGRRTTVLVTAFFGLFGLIPATRDSNRARQLGDSGGLAPDVLETTIGGYNTPASAQLLPDAASAQRELARQTALLQES